MEKERETSRTNNNEVKEEAAKTKKKDIKGTILWILIFINFVVGFINIKTIQYYETSHTVKFKEIRKELSVEDFVQEPGNRDFAWDSEDIPLFVTEDFEKAIAKDKYDGVEYTYGENKIQIEEEWFFSDDESRIMVNNDLSWQLKNYSIYSSGDKIVIYGYWNKEFRKIVVGKEKDDVEQSILTVNPEIPFSAHSLTTAKISDRYLLVLGSDGHTVSAYKDKKMIGEPVYIDAEISGIYSQMLLTVNNELYMTYLLNNDGKEEFACIKVATVTSEAVESASSLYKDDVYGVRYFATFKDSTFIIFEENDSIKMLVPNDIEKYNEYMKGTADLSYNDDLNWHWLEIK